MVDYNIVLEDARIGFRNFAGAEDDFNPAGSRNFSVFPSEEDALAWREDGWNVKEYRPKGQDEIVYHLPVAVRMDGQYPPKIYLITEDNMTPLDESTISELDSAVITRVDVKIRPYNWSNAMGHSGVKAYVESLYVTIEEDELAKKYRKMFQGE